MPCLDSITCKSESFTISNSSNHDHSKDKEDLCSPFCVCACCGSYVFLFVTHTIHLENIVKVIPSIFVSFYHTDFISSYYYSFWQPPKISLS